MNRSSVWDENQLNNGEAELQTGVRGGKRRHTAFYVETLVLAAVFTVVILVLARVFAFSGQISVRARMLTNAVHLAENAAEVLNASGSVEEAALLLEQDGNVIRKEGAFSAGYDLEMEPSVEGDFRVEVTWTPQEESWGTGNLVRSVITVWWKDGAEPVYTLETAVYIEGDNSQSGG